MLWLWDLTLYRSMLIWKWKLQRWLRPCNKGIEIVNSVHVPAIFLSIWALSYLHLKFCGLQADKQVQRGWEVCQRPHSSQWVRKKEEILLALGSILSPTCPKGCLYDPVVFIKQHQSVIRLIKVAPPFEWQDSEQWSNWFTQGHILRDKNVTLIQFPESKFKIIFIKHNFWSRSQVGNMSWVISRLGKVMAMSVGSHSLLNVGLSFQKIFMFCDFLR